MSDKIIENNQVTIMGQIASGFTFSHTVFGEGFYMVDVLVRRLSSSQDRIPLMISERLMDVTQDYTGEFIMATGQFRSYNRHDEQKNRLILSVFVREVSFIDEELDGPRRIRSCWTDISANCRCTAKRRLEGRLPIFFWQSTGHMGNPIIFPASAGGEMPDLPLLLRWGSMSRCLGVYRAENT